MEIATITEATTSLSPLHLFLQADPVVKLVMLGLVLASIWTWAIIFSFIRRHRNSLAAIARYEKALSSSPNPQQFIESERDKDLSLARILGAAVDEWRISTSRNIKDKDAIRQRIALALDSAIAKENNNNESRISILATIGSITPFVGLFGTVWGIMRSFTAIAEQQSTSLSVVAPGIAEALFATALGLFAAIPAVIAYNRIQHKLAQVEALINEHSDRLQLILSRELDQF